MHTYVRKGQPLLINSPTPWAGAYLSWLERGPVPRGPAGSSPVAPASSGHTTFRDRARDDAPCHRALAGFVFRSFSPSSLTTKYTEEQIRAIRRYSMSEPIAVTVDTFEDEVLNSEVPVLVDFWAATGAGRTLDSFYPVP